MDVRQASLKIGWSLGVALLILAASLSPRPGSAQSFIEMMLPGALFDLVESSNLALQIGPARTLTVDTPGFSVRYLHYNEGRAEGSCAMLWQFSENNSYGFSSRRVSAYAAECGEAFDTFAIGNAPQQPITEAISGELFTAMFIARELFDAAREYGSVNPPVHRSLFPDMNHMAANFGMMAELREGVEENFRVEINPGTLRNIVLEYNEATAGSRPSCEVSIVDHRSLYLVMDFGCDGTIDAHADETAEPMPFPDAGYEGLVMGVLLDLRRFWKVAQQRGID